MIKKLDFYITKELLPPLCIGVFSFLLLFHAGILSTGYKDFQDHPDATKAVFLYLCYKTPGFLNLIIPIGMAFGSSLSISRLARESEIVAIKSAGVPLFRIIFSTLVVGIILAIINFLLVETFTVHAEKKATEIKNEAVYGPKNIGFKKNLTLFLKNDYVASFREATRKKNNKVFLLDPILIKRSSQDTMEIYQGEYGVYDQGEWMIHQPIYRKLFHGELINHKKLPKFTFQHDVNIANLFAPPSPSEQTISELRKSIKEGREQKQDVTDLEIAYHVKFSIPAASIVFAFTGSVFSILASRFGGFMGLLVSIFMVMCYFNIHVAATSIIGKHGWLSPFFAAWISNIIFALAGYLGVKKAE